MPDSETMVIVLEFAAATLLPVAAAVAITRAEVAGRLDGLGQARRQALVGVVFGAIAILGTEFGIKTPDAVMNVRDAAPIVAGLYFGGPAGVVAGLMGGIERWFSVLWGRGMYTRVACTVATAIMGPYAALLRRYLFDERRPSWLLALIIGMVAEVLHLLLIFVTNIGDAAHAFEVVRACSVPMIGCVGLSVALAAAGVALARGQRLGRDSTLPDISHKVQSGMLAVVAIGFVASVGFIAVLQGSLTASQTTDELSLEIGDVRDDILNTSNTRLLELTRRVADAIPSTGSADDGLCARLAEALGVNEVHVIGPQGTIVCSSNASYVGFDMASGEQSAEYLDLLPGGGSRSLVQEYQPQSIDGVWRKIAGVSIADGFVQVSYDGSRFADSLRELVGSSVAYRHVGREGLLVVYGEDGALVGTRKDVDLSSADAARLASAMDRAQVGTLAEVALHGAAYYAMVQDVEGFRVVGMLPASEANMAGDLSVLVTSFMEVLVFAALFVAIYLLIKHVVVRSIWRVNGTLGRITSGDLDIQVDVRNSTEFASLSDDINGTVRALREAIAAEAQRIERDLATAHAIQESALPNTFPAFPDIGEFDVYASMNAARQVGGDFYDFFLVDEHTLGFLIADVSGKGIPASLFMMAAKAELANNMSAGVPLNVALQIANWHLCQGNDEDMFVTVWAALLDWRDGTLTFVNAGHNPPLLRRGQGGPWEWLRKRNGLVLGMMETAKYTQTTIGLRPGDMVLLYTDGVSEAFSADEEQYGNDRLEAFVNRHGHAHPLGVVEALREDVAAWSAGAEQSDDITILALEYGGDHADAAGA